MPKNTKTPKQGEIFRFKMSETDENGHVISGTHNGIVISPDWMNSRIQTVNVVMITSRERPGWDWRVPFQFIQGDPKITSYVMTEQILTLDRSFLKNPVGFIRSADLKKILTNIREIFKER